MGLFELLRRKPTGNRFQRTFRIHGVKVRIGDIPTSIAPTIAHELKIDTYGLQRIPFKPGDVVVDIGGHIGLPAIYLAMRYPQIHVHAFEPCPPNYRSFVENIARNGVTNVTVDNLAITADRRDLQMIINLENSGGATGNLADMRLPGHEYFTVPSITLDDAFGRYNIARCKLLKIDCEGSEHEILRSTSVLDRVEWLSGEFHINRRLEAEGHSIDGLVRYLTQSIPRERICYEPCRMAE